MLKTPKYGWSEITIGDWSDRCSDIGGYHDDVPYRLLEAVDDTNRTGMPSSVKFDAEGWEYIIVFDIHETHIITYDEDANYKYTTIEISIKDIIKELLADIRKDLKVWSEWGIDRNEYEIKERYNDLSVWCDVIERRLSWT